MPFPLFDAKPPPPLLFFLWRSLGDWLMDVLPFFCGQQDVEEYGIVGSFSRPFFDMRSKLGRSLSAGTTSFFFHLVSLCSASRAELATAPLPPPLRVGEPSKKVDDQPVLFCPVPFPFPYAQSEEKAR